MIAKTIPEPGDHVLVLGWLWTITRATRWAGAPALTVEYLPRQGEFGFRFFAPEDCRRAWTRDWRGWWDMGEEWRDRPEQHDPEDGEEWKG